MARKTPTELAKSFLAARASVPTSRLGRLVRTGRSAVGLATSMLGARDDEPTERELASIAAMVGRLGELKGVAMKMGQIASFIDPSLQPEVRELLALLQTTSPASPFEAVEATLREQLGPRADALLAHLEKTPIAVASIGQVHRATLPDGTPVAVKVRHAGIEAAMRADFASATAGLAMTRLMLPGLAANAREVVDEARTAFLEECDFALEAERQELFGRLFANDPIIVVPEVLREWCAPGVLTTRWRPGESFDEFLARDPSQQQRDAVGEALFSFYVGALYRAGHFHGDPHPGNYAVTAEGRVVVYDYGCVRSFPPETVRALAGLVDALRRQAGSEVLRGLGRQLGFHSSLEGADFEAFVRFARGFFAPLLTPGPHAIPPDGGFDARAVIRDKRLLARLGLPGRLLFLVRIRFGLYAVLSRLGAKVDWGALEASWARDVLSAPK